MLSLPVVIVVFLPPFYARYGNTLAQKQTTALKTHLKRRPRLHSEKKGGGVGMGKTAGWLEKIISSRNNKGNAENALAPLHSHFPPAVCRLSLPAFAPLTGNFRRLGLRPSTSFEPPATHSTPT